MMIIPSIGQKENVKSEVTQKNNEEFMNAQGQALREYNEKLIPLGIIMPKRRYKGAL